MNKKSILAVGVVVIILILIVIASLFSKHKNSVPEETNKAPAQTITEHPKAAPLVTEKKIEKYYTIDLEYPESTATSFPEILSYVTKVKSDFLEIAPASDQDADAKDITVDRSYSLKMDTTIYTSPDTVSYKLETYMFTGGAHGGTYLSTFTYDKAGRLITTESLLSSSDALNKISTASRSYFYKKFGDDVEKEIINVGTEPKIENFSTWYISEETITFIFQQYQIGPYALGIQEFALPLTSIR